MDQELVKVNRFRDGVAQFIAREYAAGSKLSELHQAYPDRVPSPWVISQWRADYKHFDELMKQSEAVWAERLFWEQLSVVDDRRVSASKAKARADVRMRMAAVLDPVRYGTRGDRRNSPSTELAESGRGQGMAVNLSDRDLMMIAAGDDGGIDVSIQRGTRDGGGHPPAADSDGGDIYCKQGPSTTQSKSSDGQVTSHKVISYEPEERGEDGEDAEPDF